MKKLRLKALSLGAKEILNREQLKTISGGSGSGSYAWPYNCPKPGEAPGDNWCMCDSPTNVCFTCFGWWAGPICAAQAATTCDPGRAYGCTPNTP